MKLNETKGLKMIKTKPQLKIEKGIPVPNRRNEYNQFVILSTMKVGDSFFLSEKLYNVPSATSSARVYAREHDVEISCRSVEGGGSRLENGVIRI